MPSCFPKVIVANAQVLPSETPLEAALANLEEAGSQDCAARSIGWQELQGLGFNRSRLTVSNLDILKTKREQ